MLSHIFLSRGTRPPHGSDPLTVFSGLGRALRGPLWMNDLEMDVSYDHSSEVELWGVLLCAQQLPRPYTHTQTDRKEKDEGKKTERESERKGQGQIGGREERTPPCFLHTRDSGALVTSCLFKRADCIVIADWLKPFSFSLLSSRSVFFPLVSFSLAALFCFVFTNNKRDARVSSRQETSFLWRLKRAASPPPHTPPYEWADHTNWAAPTG